jgi:radical SAM superfamily enzyme YgiQ (UPF0313 family)
VATLRVVLLATYELGRQPFGLASPAAWLRQAGVSVICQDLSRSRLDRDAILAADLVAFYVPMHTATRIAIQVAKHVRTLNPRAHLTFYGLYAPMNSALLRKLGAGAVFGGEFEAGLLQFVQRLQTNPQNDTQVEDLISLERQRFRVPDRRDLPPLPVYAQLQTGEGSRVVGYTEASRGCKHLCRHCPIVPVYEGRFRIVQRDVVLQDIRQQVAAGAEHITFGDPDFFNGTGHTLPLVQELHREFPQITYDVTIKVEHLLRHARHLPALRETGCLMVTSAVESVQDDVLRLLDKGHSREDFLQALATCRRADIYLNPTFVAFMPWVSLADYINLLSVIAAQGLVDHVAPIQLAMRLLIPDGSKLLELPEMRWPLREFDADALSYRWQHPDARMDALCKEALQLVQNGEAEGACRPDLFGRLWHAAHKAAQISAPEVPTPVVTPTRAPVPYLDEPWYC